MSKYLVIRHPYNDPKLGLIPVGEVVDLSHLDDEAIKIKLERRQIAPVKTKRKAADEAED